MEASGIRTLSLHGYASCSDAFITHKAKALRAHEAGRLSLSGPDGPAKLQGGRGRQHAWWRFEPDYPMDRALQPAFWALEEVGYSSADATIDALVHEWHQGSYEAILGFSQGALCAAMLVARLEQLVAAGHPICLPRFVILCHGFITPRPSNVELRWWRDVQIGTLATPAILLAGEHDTSVPRAKVQELGALFARAQLHTIVGGAHAMPRDMMDLRAISTLVDMLSPPVSPPHTLGDATARASIPSPPGVRTPMAPSPSVAAGRDVVARDVACDTVPSVPRSLERPHCSGRVWPAAETLLAHCSTSLPHGALVLEIGSGTGWFGIELSRRRADLQICLTEMREFEAYPRLEAAVAAAIAKAAAGVAEAEALPRLTCASFDWRERPPDLGRFDFVVGSDLVYSEETAAALGSVLCALLTPDVDITLAADVNAASSDSLVSHGASSTIRMPAATRDGAGAPGVVLTPASASRCWLAHTCERWGAYGYDTFLLASLRAHALRAVPLGNAATRHLSDDAPIEQRQAIFEIRPGGTPGGDDQAAERLLTRASRAQAARDARELAAMTPEEVAEASATAAFASLFTNEDSDSDAPLLVL